MTNEEREKVASVAEEQYAAHLNAGAQTFGGLGSNREYLQQQVPQVAPPSLRERIRAQRMHAQNASNRLNQLHELEYLLEKHPEVARMLELIDAIRD